MVALADIHQGAHHPSSHSNRKDDKIHDVFG